MIKINLLGDDTGIDYTGKMILLGYGASVVLCILICALLYSGVKSDVADLQIKADDAQRKLDALKERTKEVRDLEKKRETLRNKLEQVAKLKRSKMGPVRVMDDLNLAVPERVWLRQLLEQDTTIRIKGRALNNQHLAIFLKNLEASEFFDKVELVESRQMYYSKRTGKVTPMPDVQALRTNDFQRDSRDSKEDALKEGKSDGGQRWSVRSDKSDSDESERDRAVNDRNIKIKEFIITASVRYAGVLKGAAALEEGKKTLKSLEGKGARPLVPSQAKDVQKLMDKHNAQLGAAL